MNRPLNLITLFSTILLAFVMSLYLFTSALDEWVIEKSLKRYCGTIKEDFAGQFYSPAYICTFMEGIE